VLHNVNSATSAAKRLANSKGDLLSSAFMQMRSEVLNQTVDAVPDRLAIERIELRTVRLPLHEPFETSFGRIDSRLLFLVAVKGGGETGWGEVVAAEERSALRCTSFATTSRRRCSPNRCAIFRSLPRVSRRFADTTWRKPDSSWRTWTWSRV
jgi:hypothetical protein